MAPGQLANHNRIRADSANLSSHTEDEALAELDEPPDRKLTFWKMPPLEESRPANDFGIAMSPHSRKQSLLTQALLFSPELTPLFDTDAPHLMSDGGLTSPARTTTPSPPLPAPMHAGLLPLQTKDLPLPNQEKSPEAYRMHQPLGIDRKEETKVEETLGRKRCISFACGKKTSSPEKPAQAFKSAESKNISAVTTEPAARRPCLLRFVCPTKPLKTDSEEREDCPRPPRGALSPTQSSTASFGEAADPASSTDCRLSNTPPASDMEHHSRADAVIKASVTGVFNNRGTSRFNRMDFEKSEATRFHAFAGINNVEDEWTNEQTAYRQKMTINDTLHKELAIRKLAEDAEEEAALEEEMDLLDDGEDIEAEDEDEGEFRDLNASSDDGNISDDENGFADSDDGSEGDLDYSFWTPGMTTAATSTDHLEHIQPLKERNPSSSSIECPKRTEESPSQEAAPRPRSRISEMPRRIRYQPHKISHNPEDFIVGTLDEDRPLQEAYVSSLEQRKRSKQKIIPQDIDPSFPTSDPEADDDGNESGDELVDDGDDDGEVSDAESRLVCSPPGHLEDERRQGHRPRAERRDRTPAPSPRGLRSPVRGRLFNQTTHRLRSPPPSSKWLASPPGSRRPSPSTGTTAAEPQDINIQHLAQRPNLTRTASLPRTANPFWGQLHKATPYTCDVPRKTPWLQNQKGTEAELHTRGPIDIVQGLEQKRQRRREKFWRLHCQKAHAGKEKERKCQPGKGAERMRELGARMQDRLRGYGHNRPNLMLSV